MLLTKKNKIFLEEIQKDLPLVSDPYKKIASKTGLSEKKIINKIKILISKKIIRELSAIFNSKKLGYKSTLVAMHVDPVLINTITKKINDHPGVSHNYLRSNKYNIWFTLTIKNEKKFEDEIKKILKHSIINKYLILPSNKSFKTNVFFKFTNKDNNNYNNTIIDKKIILNDLNIKLINQLQNNNYILSNPWKNISDSLNISEKYLFLNIQKLKDIGALKRISAVIRHQKVGYKSNCMICFNVPENKINKAGKIISNFPEVSHCYQRQTYTDWNYSLYVMIHQHSKKQCNILIENLSNKINCKDYQILYSLKELKKERVKYNLLL